MSASGARASKATASASRQDCVDQFNDLMQHMAATKEQLDAEHRIHRGDDDELGVPSASAATTSSTDRLLSEAIEFAIEQGRGWGPGEKEEYLKRIGDDDFIPPLFASSVDEVAHSGLQEAFTSLIYDNETPTALYLRFKDKGNEAFTNGRRNQASNLQYYRDAINHYLESLAWAEKIEPLRAGDLAQADTDDPTFTSEELKHVQSNLCSNIALMHLHLSNWGLVREYATRATSLHPSNVKAWFRLAKAHQQLRNWEGAGDAVEAGLAVEPDNRDLVKLQKQLDANVRRARTVRQQRERARAQRAAHVKAVWMHCKSANATPRKVRLGRVNLVSRVREDDDDEAEGDDEGRWHQHLPHSGLLPHGNGDASNAWSWPVLFLYPTHHQSDLVEQFGEVDLFAEHLATLFPEAEEGGGTAVPWDHQNEFQCSQLAIYFEVHGGGDDKSNGEPTLYHPDCVEPIQDLATCLKYHEATRALKGDEGQDVADVVRALERKRLANQRSLWKKRHGSLWAKPDPCPVVRVHPAATLMDALTDPRMIVPNFLATFVVFPETHPAHTAFLKEHKCLGLLQPERSP